MSGPGIAAACARYDDGDDEGARLAADVARRLAYRRRHGGKLCGACGVPHPISAFGPDARTRDGLRSMCRESRRARPLV